jgi:6-pyruvoyltetrahydropterin/6-carboxytetrahydropterin synthase
MRAYLSRRYILSASHRLYSKAYSEEKNRAVYGKCSNPHGHGHNYVVEVTVGGQVDPVTGMVCNLADLDHCVQSNVIDRFDHTNLNFDVRFASEVPTTENLCIAIHNLLAEHFVHADLERVRVEETRNNFFEYAGERKHGTSSSRS